jgi:putative ABC transport system substrate-binding protein
MKRRDFISLVGGAMAWPRTARAQQPQRMRLVGVLTSGAENSGQASRIADFRNALMRLGWIEGQNVRTAIHWGANDLELIGSYARAIVEMRPDVILAGPSSALLPLQKLTRTIPIVFVSVSDPLGQGIVSSLARPNGNVTGFSNLEFSLAGKWLRLLKDVAPGVARVGVMIATSNAVSGKWFQTFDELAPTFGVEVMAAPIAERADIERVIATLAAQPNGGLILPGDTFVEAPSIRPFIAGVAAAHRVPTLYTLRAFPAEGGLMSYGIDQSDVFVKAASYVDRILKGESPADLPVQQPSKFDFVINLKAAKALKLTVPEGLLLAADEVIE